MNRIHQIQCTKCPNIFDCDCGPDWQHYHDVVSLNICPNCRHNRSDRDPDDFADDLIYRGGSLAAGRYRRY